MTEGPGALQTNVVADKRLKKKLNAKPLDFTEAFSCIKKVCN